MGNVLARVFYVTGTLVMRLMQYCTARLSHKPSNVDDIEVLARSSLLKDVYGFYSSGSVLGNQQTMKENRNAYSRYQIRPRYVRDTSDFDMKVKLLGEEISLPICVAPTVGQCILHWEGEKATARACSEMNTCMGLSAFSTTSMEDVAEASGKSGVRWFHLMLTLSDDLLKEHITQAKKFGYKALVITVDQPNVSIPRDNLHIFNMKLTTFPLLKIPPNVPVVKYVVANCFSSPITWERIEWVRTLTNLPIVIKGILTAEDAIEALEHNVSAIVVSNHGGRQLDCVPATIDVLEEVVNAVGDKVEVYLDGGIRNGIDVFKALALGAKAVFIGRPVLWGLAYKGSDGVEKVLSILKEELEVTMRLAGCSRLSDIKRDMVVRHTQYTSHRSRLS